MHNFRSFLGKYNLITDITDIGYKPTGLPRTPGEGGSLTAASGVPEVCQVLDLPGSSHGAGGQLRRPAHVWRGCASCFGGRTFLKNAYRSLFVVVIMLRNLMRLFLQGSYSHLSCTEGIVSGFLSPSALVCCLLLTSANGSLVQNADVCVLWISHWQTVWHHLWQPSDKYISSSLL